MATRTQSKRVTEGGSEADGDAVRLRSVGQIAASQANRTFAGRKREIALLLHTVSDSGPALVYVHGIAGVGKSRLISAFADEAQRNGAAVVILDCRGVEPTEEGFLRAVGARFGKACKSVEDGIKALAATGSRVVLALDHYEVMRLLDTWLRQTFVPRLPGSVRLIIADREPPSPAWTAAPGWQGLLRTIEVDTLPAEDAAELLTRLGVPEAGARRINRVAQGHPLALTLAASSLQNRQDSSFEDLAIHRVIEELTQLYLADIADPITRATLEAACVLRRVTVSLLRALLPDVAAQDAFSALRSLPFAHIDPDGLHIHDLVKQVMASGLRASDPSKYRDYRRAAWSQLRKELATAPGHELWRYTADMLYLLENPVIREAFFPTGAQLYAVEPAREEDGTGIAEIWKRQDGKESAVCLRKWWAAAPQTFSVVRDRTGKTVGFYCLCEASRIPEPMEDPMAKLWLEHLRAQPISTHEAALFLRRWLSVEEGEKPSAVQAACWLDIKRTYISLRPRLRRVYLALQDFGPYAAVAQTLGFAPIPTANVDLDGRTYHSAMLDFGPASVDGWLARLVGAELGVTATSVLDVEARELVLDGARVPLTRMEFALFRYLQEREGKAVGREDLIRDVWGHKYDVGSNVVDATIKALRKKLGSKAESIETVPGYGYRFRPAH